MHIRVRMVESNHNLQHATHNLRVQSQPSLKHATHNLRVQSQPSTRYTQSHYTRSPFYTALLWYLLKTLCCTRFNQLHLFEYFYGWLVRKPWDAGRVDWFSNVPAWCAEHEFAITLRQRGGADDSDQKKTSVVMGFYWHGCEIPSQVTTDHHQWSLIITGDDNWW
jgi:hypothetical protein